VKFGFIAKHRGDLAGGVVMRGARCRGAICWQKGWHVDCIGLSG